MSNKQKTVEQLGAVGILLSTCGHFKMAKLKKYINGMQLI